MLKSFIKRTRKGRIVKIVREHYLRSDICCGSEICGQCAPIRQKNAELNIQPPSYLDVSSRYFVLDTNVILKQIDILEHPSVKQMIILSVVLDEVKSNSLPIYIRLRKIIADPSRRFFVFLNEHHRDTYIEREKGETPNDRNDRAIRVATLWYQQHLSVSHAGTNVVLLTGDIENERKARELGINVSSFHTYVRDSLQQHPEIMDMIAFIVPQTGLKQGKKLPFLLDKPQAVHLPMVDLMAGIRRCKYYQGIFRAAKEGYGKNGIVTANIPTPGKGVVERDVNIIGLPSVNRALHNDIVAIRLISDPEKESVKENERKRRKFDKWEEQPTEKVSVIDPFALVEEEVELDESEEEDSELEEELSEESDDDAMVDEILTGTGVLYGEIVGIVRRRGRIYVGSIEKDVKVVDDGVVNVVVKLIDDRMPKLHLRTTMYGSLFGQRLAVRIDEWPINSMYPMCHFVRDMGAAGSKEVETDSFLVEHEIPTEEFSKPILACLPNHSPDNPWKITPRDEEERLDLRKTHRVFSVDPVGCTDIDDALHVRQLDNGLLEIGVHIADVTHFVRPGTAIDAEASRRASTVYLVDRRIDMLPSLLGTNLCSLKENEDRLSFSVIWQMDKETADIKKTWFGRTIINSQHAFTYEEAQNSIDNTNLNDPLTENIRLMNNMAKIISKKRKEAGALILASPEVKFTLSDEAESPIDVNLYKSFDTNSMIAEFMVLANTSVAERICDSFPHCALLRRHANPRPVGFEKLKLGCKAVLGIDLDASSNKALSSSLDQIPDKFKDRPEIDKLVRILATRCMSRALYFSSGTQMEDDYYHYGLALPIYTHFTSPIRRYADCIVHRMLFATIGGSVHDGVGSRSTDVFGVGLNMSTDMDTGTPTTVFPTAVSKPKKFELSKIDVQAVSNNINRRSYAAQLAGRDSVQLYSLMFFKGKKVNAIGHVIGVQDESIRVLVDKFGLEGAVPFKKIEVGQHIGADLNWAVERTVDGTETTVAIGVSAHKSGQNVAKLRLFDKVNILISVEDDTSHVSLKISI